MAAIVSFLLSGDWLWLYWHQVVTGWTALALLYAALVFSRGLRWRRWYSAVVLFPPVWSYIAIYRLDHFLWAARPGGALPEPRHLWTGWVFLQYRRRVRLQRRHAAGGRVSALGPASSRLPVSPGARGVEPVGLLPRHPAHPGGRRRHPPARARRSAPGTGRAERDLGRPPARRPGAGRARRAAGPPAHAADGPGQRALPARGRSRAIRARGRGLPRLGPRLPPDGAAGRLLARALATGRPQVTGDWPDPRRRGAPTPTPPCSRCCATRR